MLDFGQDIGIDLGTATVIAYVKGKGIVLREPSVVAKNVDTGEILAVGESARKMLGKTPGNIIATRPLKEGVISDYKVTEEMLKYFINKIVSKPIFSPRMMICVPSLVTEVEKKAVIDAASSAGARKVYLIEEPIAAALGAGLDIFKPNGNLVVDIGGGTTDIAVISVGGKVLSTSIKVAGDNFDEAIVKYIKRMYGLVIGEKTAEEIKINIGCIYPKVETNEMEVKGRDVYSGLPKRVIVKSDDMIEALKRPVESILEGIRGILEKTPPELAGDIYKNGIYLTGGGCLLDGLDKVIFNNTGIKTFIANDSISCVAIGTGKALEHLDKINQDD